MITASTVKVWRSSEKGRRYFSRRAAIHAEAKAIIFARYHREEAEHVEGRMTYPGWSIAYDEPERYAKMLRRLKRLIDRKTEK